MATRTEMAVNEAYEEIDAALFSSDYLSDKDARKELAHRLERWQRKLTEHYELEMTCADEEIQRLRRDGEAD